MKKIFYFVSSLCLIASCSTEENSNSSFQEFPSSKEIYNDKSYIENAELKEKLEYKKHHLKEIAKWISNNDVDVLNTVKKNMDKDVNQSRNEISLFLKDLDIDFKKKLGIESLTKFESSLDAFVGLEGESWYPKITILNASKLVNKSTFDSEKPIIVISEYEEEIGVESLVGYQENAEGDLMELDEPVTEEFAMDKTVLVLSIDNEILPIDDEYGGGTSGGGGSSGGTYYYRLKLNKLRLKQHKEDWHNGASELHFAGFKVSSLPLYSGDCGDNMTGSANCYTDDGNRVIKVSRGDVGDEFTVNYTINTYNSYSTNDIIFFVLFEQDSWPATRNIASFPFPNGEIRNVYYRSWQGSYDQIMLSMNSNNSYGLPLANGYSKENSGIKYNLTFGY